MNAKNMTSLFLILGTICFIIAIYYWQKKPPVLKDNKSKSTISVIDKNNSSEENKEKGNQFEDYVISFLHTNDDMKLLSKVSDYYKNGKGAADNQTPDLKMLYKGTKFAVECKYRTSFSENKIIWAKEYQVKNYFNFEKETNQKVFIAIGIGGTANKPESLYILPLYRLTRNFATKEYIREYKIVNIKEFLSKL
jgi:Holliday junction resolvase